MVIRPVRAVVVFAAGACVALGPFALVDARAEASARGVAVVAVTGAEPAAWSLAKELYARDLLRPAFDETRARVLAGSPAAADAPKAVRDLADERASVRGDDGASRALLDAIAAQTGVRVVVVAMPDGTARVYLPESHAFDAARYAPDATPVAPGASNPVMTADAGADANADASPAAPPTEPTSLHWSGTVASLERAFGAPPPPPAPPGPPPAAPALATREAPPPATPAKPAPPSTPFYASPWFWGAIGAAAFGGTAVYFATRDNSPSTIHLELQVH